MKKLTYLMILLFTVLSCTQENKQGKDAENASRNEQRMMEFYQTVMNEHNPAMVDSFCTPDFVEHQPFPGYPADRIGLKMGLSELFTAFPDLTFTVDMIKSWSDTVITKIKMKGTNSGAFMGMPATNKSIEIEGVDIVVLKNGKATEHWGYSEEMKMMSQLGMGEFAVEENEENERE